MSENLKQINKEFWEEKYIQGHMPWDIGQAAPALIKYFELNSYPQGAKIAVIGCGRGHDAFYLAKNKKNEFNVFGIDYSENAIKYCNEINKKEQLKNLSFYQTDIFELLKEKTWKEYFDLVVEHTCLAAINPNDRKNYAKLVYYLLKPGGRLVGLFFNRPQELSGPPFGITADGVRDLFQDNFRETEELKPAKCLHRVNLKGEEWFGVFEKN